MFDVCVIGHVTKDIIRIGCIEKEMPGGAAYYFSVALKNLGANVSLITKVAEEDRSLLNDLINNNITVFYKNSQETTVFENVYLNNFDFRVQNVRCVAQPFSVKDIPDISAQMFHLGPLTKDDIPLEILKYISKKVRLSVDIQGFLRRIERSKVKSNDWEEKDEGLACINILKTDETEAKVLSGEGSVRKAIVKLSTYGIDEIVITLGSKGSLIYSNGKLYSIQPFPVKKIVDATGCGDTYMAGYIYKRLKSSDINESGRFASAIASLKIEKSGPFRGSDSCVQNFLRSQSMKTH